MEELFYTYSETRKDEDGFDEKWVYVPAFDEWMTEDDFYIHKSQFDPSIQEAETYFREHSDDDVYPEDTFEDDAFEEDEYEDIDPDDYENMTREEAMEDYERTGINHSKYDLNDWEEINRTLGFDFLDLSKRPK